MAGLEGAETVKTVLQNKRVLYVSQARNVPGARRPRSEARRPPPPAIESVIIVFAGTDQDAELIKLAQNDVETGPLSRDRPSRSVTTSTTTTGVTIRS